MNVAAVGRLEGDVIGRSEAEIGLLGVHRGEEIGKQHVYLWASKRVFNVHGGFADVTPSGLTILAEAATEVAAA